MAIPGSYYIVDVSKADRLAPGKTREPLDPSDTSNLRRNKEGTQFVISSTETIPGANYVQKFETREDMIAYINSNSDWVLDDMTTTRTEQTAVDFKSITGVQRDNLLNAWIPKQIMYAGTAESASTVSEGFVAGDNTDTDELAIRRWRDINYAAEATITAGYVGGDESSFNRTLAYDNGMFMQEGRRSILDIGSSQKVPSGDWTILCGFQPNDATRMATILVGSAASTLKIFMDSVNKVKFQHRDAEGIVTDIAALPLAANQIKGLRGSTVQMYPIFITWSASDAKYTIPNCVRLNLDGGGTSASYSVTGDNSYAPSEADQGTPSYPSSFAEDGEVQKNERITEHLGSMVMVGCYAVWDTVLTTSDMNTLDDYLLNSF